MQARQVFGTRHLGPPSGEAGDIAGVDVVPSFREEFDQPGAQPVTLARAHAAVEVRHLCPHIRTVVGGSRLAQIGMPRRTDARVCAERTELEALGDFERRSAVEREALCQAAGPEDRGVGRSEFIGVAEIVVTRAERAGEFGGANQFRKVAGIGGDAGIQA